MKIDQKFEEIMNHVLSGKGPGKDDCKYLLSFELLKSQMVFLV